MQSSNYEARKAKYKARYAALIAQLGGKCENCGTTCDLTIDHWNGRNWGCRPETKSSWHRVVIYEREHNKGLVRCLCCSCNAVLWVNDRKLKCGNSTLLRRTYRGRTS